MTTTQGVSLRAVARTLGYAPSSLHEARGAGHFEELPGGGYSVQAVAQGLLDNSSPRADRRELLKKLAATPDAPQPSRRRSMRFGPKTEAAILASCEPHYTEEAHQAFMTLASLPKEMAEAYDRNERLLDPVASEPVFFDATLELLRWLFRRPSPAALRTETG